MPAGVPNGTEIVRVDDAVDPGVRVTVPGVVDSTGPEGETVADSETTPEKPVLVMLIKGAAVEPTLILERGVTATLKLLPTFTITMAVFDIEPLVAVTVMV